jgi:hypothetical protein
MNTFTFTGDNPKFTRVYDLRDPRRYLDFTARSLEIFLSLFTLPPHFRSRPVPHRDPKAEVNLEVLHEITGVDYSGIIQ